MRARAAEPTGCCSATTPSPTASSRVADAIRVAGDRHADYVRIRTRSEVAWLRLVSEWFEQEARRLDGELTAAR